jgi:hypothetical protein
MFKASGLTISAAQLLALLGLGLPTACDRAGGIAEDCPAESVDPLAVAALERRIAAAAPPGWSVVRRVDGAVPYGVVPGSAGLEPGSIGLTLAGPERVAVSGYYCAHGTFCASPVDAREALEIWIMPRAFAETAGPVAWTTRGASLIARCHGQAIYGLVSRYAGDVLDFDGGFTQSSTETSQMPPQSGDLATSWQTWRQDLKALIR